MSVIIIIMIIIIIITATVITTGKLSTRPDNDRFDVAVLLTEQLTGLCCVQAERTESCRDNHRVHSLPANMTAQSRFGCSF